MKKDLISILDLTKEEILEIFKLARKVKGEVKTGKYRDCFNQKTLAMIFEKPSLRTRVSFEAGFTQLGGHAIYLGPKDISLGSRESVPDIARNLDRMVDIIMARVFAHKSVEELAKYSKIPVINGLSDKEHPCQVLADYLTIEEHKGRTSGIKFTFVGAGNNMSHSLMLISTMLGADFYMACAKGYEPDNEYVEKSKEMAKRNNSKVVITYDPVEAVKDADVVYTDVWASMGEEAEKEERAKAFKDYQVNMKLFKNAKSDAIFMHCLPAHRGEEVTDDVIDSSNSVVFDEAENRLHAQKAVMLKLLGVNE
ncbi:MAG: Ornithine carbamoyltransferase, catabolic [candidate division TA06 bacterium 32_111]|uniref:Ornithine carbamoyltransferase n=2 Tax=Bacteria candidate phyla TaxID=1783234 RepID=A0A101I2L5_UNCT6|nr:MAG: Ornithine carbamoyltransferase, catabolic [candidate division TA06 bacterium 32_111]KUK87470.1 MAG: Ornithine carbamoyltransferase, catabolic [candidate division TA06 bacterium 34_109]HAF08193.1 ornithine carbamoyltransferase [candidate division WOR-3 bacterium]HCP16755.1 ornithine carbamoyltransferase [candidate division WOR-3 bacterium]